MANMFLRRGPAAAMQYHGTPAWGAEIKAEMECMVSRAGRVFRDMVVTYGDDSLINANTDRWRSVIRDRARMTEWACDVSVMEEMSRQLGALPTIGPRPDGRALQAVTLSAVVNRVMDEVQDLRDRIDEIREIQDLPESEVRRAYDMFVEEDDHVYEDKVGRALLREVGYPEGWTPRPVDPPAWTGAPWRTPTAERISAASASFVEYLSQAASIPSEWREVARARDTEGGHARMRPVYYPTWRDVSVTYSVDSDADPTL